jgi:hypothetical protein
MEEVYRCDVYPREYLFQISYCDDKSRLFGIGLRPPRKNDGVGRNGREALSLDLAGGQRGFGQSQNPHKKKKWESCYEDFVLQSPVFLVGMVRRAHLLGGSKK